MSRAGALQKETLLTKSFMQHSDEVREVVRQRYAEAATRVAAQHRLADSAFVPVSTPLLAAIQRRIAGQGRRLCKTGRRASLPATSRPTAKLRSFHPAVLAALGCGNPAALAELKKAGEPCSTSVPVAASTSCCQPCGSVPPNQLPT